MRMAKIIVLDDYSLFRKIVAEDLAFEGNLVAEVDEPDLIWDLVPTFDPDLVIMDLYTGGKYRWDLLGKVKDLFPRIPILIFTACPLPADPCLFKADGLVIKSSDFSELHQTINNLLKPPLDASPLRKVPPLKRGGKRVQPSPPLLSSHPTGGI